MLTVFPTNWSTRNAGTPYPVCSEDGLRSPKGFRRRLAEYFGRFFNQIKVRHPIGRKRYPYNVFSKAFGTSGIFVLSAVKLRTQTKNSGFVG
jgi:hypothetical protein